MWSCGRGWHLWTLSSFLSVGVGAMSGVKSLSVHLYCGLLLILALFVVEPGYYEDGAFGIRIENVVLVVPVKTKVSVCLFKNFLFLNVGR